MKKQGKIVLLLMVILSVLLTAAGCSGGEPETPQTTTESAAAILQSPATPQNPQADVEDGTISLTWDAVNGAAGYIVALYDPDTEHYTDLDTVKTPGYSYTITDDSVEEYQFGIYAYSEAGGQKLYSPALANVTALTVEPRLEMPHSMAVQLGNTITLTAKPFPENDTVTVQWSSDDESIATVDGNGTVRGLALGETEISAAGSNGTWASCVVRVKETVKIPGKLVAITFDDGPGQYTEQLLDVLKTHNAKATFFMVGRNVSGYADVVKRMKEEGHELGNHSWDHQSLADLSAKDLKREIKDTDEAIYQACGAYPTVFRAPYGDLSNQLKKELKVPSIKWSVDTMDWETKDRKYVKKQILEQADNGAILLMHDIHQTTVEGFSDAIEKLQEDGYTLVTVTELLTRYGDTLKSGETYYNCE